LWSIGHGARAAGHHQLACRDDHLQRQHRRGGATHRRHGLPRCSRCASARRFSTWQCPAAAIRRALASSSCRGRSRPPVCLPQRRDQRVILAP
jgi:hypothetical protein